MSAPNSAGRPPIDWRRLIPLGLAIGIGPAVGRITTDGLREAWGDGPAILTGIVTAGIVALVVFGVASILARPRGPRSDD